MGTRRQVLDQPENLEEIFQKAGRIRTLEIRYPQFDFNQYRSELLHLRNLRKLSIQFDIHYPYELPEELGQLSSLRKLHLLNFGFEEFPHWVLRLTRLENLMLRGNDITQLPPELSRLADLKHLRIENTKIKSLPDELGKLEKLKTLSLVDNFELKTFNVHALGRNLRMLALSPSGIPPEEIEQLKALHPKVKFNKRYFG